MDWPVSEADIRAAYRILLRRDPDEVGWSHYVTRAEAGELTLGQLSHEMMSSLEYRQKIPARAETVDMGGVFVVVDPSEPEFGKHIARYKSWEPHIVAQVVARLSPGATFVDIGANVGIMSFHAAKVVGDKGKVIAFEPNQDNVQNFLKGMNTNGFNNVVLYPFAASDKHSVFSLQGGSNTHLGDVDEIGSLTQAFTADEFLSKVDRVDLIKIDIEGHEPQALAGLAETIRRHHPSVLCEFNPRCLRDHIGQEIGEFAAALFNAFDTVVAIEHDGAETLVGDGSVLVQLWEDRNRKAVASGALPDGMLHFDLLLQFDQSVRMMR